MPVDGNSDNRDLPFLWGSWGFRVSLKRIAEYAQVLEKLFEVEAEEILTQGIKHVAEDLKLQLIDRGEKLDSEVITNQVELLAEDNIEATVSFPTTQRKALFLIAYAKFERHMIQLCDLLSKRLGLEKNVKSYPHNGVGRARSYLIEEAKLDFPDGSHEWNETMLFNQLRNLVAHGDEDLDDYLNHEDPKWRATYHQIVDRDWSDELLSEFHPPPEFLKGVIQTFIDISILLDEIIEEKYPAVFKHQ